MPVNVFSVSMDCWLCGVSVHISTSTPPQIQHFPPSGLRLWDVTPPPPNPNPNPNRGQTVVVLTLTLTLLLPPTFFETPTN